jgi:hypothetical protein
MIHSVLKLRIFLTYPFLRLAYCLIRFTLCNVLEYVDVLDGGLFYSIYDFYSFSASAKILPSSWCWRLCQWLPIATELSCDKAYYLNYFFRLSPPMNGVRRCRGCCFCNVKCHNICVWIHYFLNTEFNKN